MQRFTAYLRNRFHEADLQVTSIQALAGGFGKQTILFDVDGKALSGAFVMRRVLREDNTPSAALMGLYGWLLDNVPDRTGRPVLLHGDLGFHNSIALESRGNDMSERAQTILIWWAWIFMVIFGVTLWGLLDMMPPPPAAWSAAQVAAFYTEHHFTIRVGAVIASWTSAFAVPLSVVISVQMARLEKGVPVWSILQFAGGIMMSIFLVLPPLFWGIAAFNPSRAPEVTALMHETGTLTLVTTDQYFIFQMVAIAYISLTNKGAGNSPFPRWIGYFTIWAALAFEVGAVGFIPKSGPFSWSGLFVYWFPLSIFGAWFTTLCVSLLMALKRQRAAAG